MLAFASATDMKPLQLASKVGIEPIHAPFNFRRDNGTATPRFLTGLLMIDPMSRPTERPLWREPVHRFQLAIAEAVDSLLPAHI
jgi:hypothetical protein